MEERILKQILDNQKLMYESQKLIIEELTVIKRGQSKLEENYAKLEQGQSKLEENYAKLEQGQGETNSRLGNLEKKVNKIEVTLENVTNRNINLLAEGYQGIIKKLDSLQLLDEKVIKLKDDQAVQRAAIGELAKRKANA